MSSRIGISLRTSFLCLLLAVTTVSGAAQTHPPAGEKTAPHQSAEVTNPNTAADSELASESKEAGGEENAQFKQSKAVKWISHLVGISPEAGYWVFVFINFAIVAGFIYWASRTNLAQAFRARTVAIQKGIEEARRASAEANARLEQIQGRLSKLDSEVAEIRAAAEADFSAEEQRIKKAAEEDARRVVETAESEIAAAAKNARRELRTYAAELAVELAKKNIKVDAQTDAALVRDFVSQLGKDGK
jgi:F-type H+-transporting ATPase subunit b